MKKLLIVGLMVSGYVNLHGASAGNFELQKLTRLFAYAFDEDNFEKFVQQYNKVNNPNALLEKLPLLYYAVNAPSNPELYIQFLLDKGADINNQGSIGINALMSAAEKGNFEVTQYLLNHGAKPGLKNRHGQTALDLAQFMLPHWQKILADHRKFEADEFILELDNDHITKLTQIISLLSSINIPAAPELTPAEKRDQEKKVISQGPPGGPAIEQAPSIPAAPELTPAEVQAVVDASRAAEAPAVPGAPAFTDQDYVRLTIAINNALAQAQPNVPAAAIPVAPTFSDEDMKRFMAEASIPVAPDLTQEQIHKITAEMNRMIREEQAAISSAQPRPTTARPSAPAGAKPSDKEQKKSAALWTPNHEIVAQRINSNFPKLAYDVIIDKELNVYAKNSNGQTLLDIAQAAKKTPAKQADWDKLINLLGK